MSCVYYVRACVVSHAFLIRSLFRMPSLHIGALVRRALSVASGRQVTVSGEHAFPTSPSVRVCARLLCASGPRVFGSCI